MSTNALGFENVSQCHQSLLLGSMIALGQEVHRSIVNKHVPNAEVAEVYAQCLRSSSNKPSGRLA
eukprot:4691561-Amphidinium_carterae.1